MAERRRHKKRVQEVSEPTKEEKAVAKYLRFNCPTKSTNMMGHRVDYFVASKAVDFLLESKWAKSKKSEDALFTTRESVVEYCNRLLKKQFFHRALKVMKKKPDKDLKKEKEKEKAKGDSSKEEEKRGKKEKDKKKDSESPDAKKEKTVSFVFLMVFFKNVLTDVRDLESSGAQDFYALCLCRMMNQDHQKRRRMLRRSLSLSLMRSSCF
uniref:Translocation protein SEC62 n=1 Tax=Electrophorus electricus TaxID=8005 RepID=A0AAY5E9T7_ELEEL